jgi:hypothetical protein
MYLGGKIMQYFRAFRNVFLIIVLVFTVFGCATGKNQVSDTEFELSAEAVPEGILLIFSNIPADATHLWLSVSLMDDTKDTDSYRSSIQSYAAITDSSVKGWVNSSQQLDKIKQTGRLIFPFVQPGVKYYISATIYNENEFSNMREAYESFYPRTAYTEIIANNGNYFNRGDVTFVLSDTNSVVTLLSEPVFLSNVIFDDQKYGFAVTILVEDGRSIGAGEHHIPDGLSSCGLGWTFEPDLTENLRNYNGGWLEIDTYYTSWVTAYANIIFDDIKWSIEIAKTPEFAFSL